MSEIIQAIGELMTIASSLPLIAAIPLYGIAESPTVSLRTACW